MDRVAIGPTRTPRLVVLEGSPHEIGLAHGRLLADEIRHLLAQMDRFTFHRFGPLAGSGLRVLSLGLASILSIHVPPRLRDELRGVALGSGAAYSDLLLLNSLDDILNILRRFSPRAPSLGCSGFAISGTHTRDGTLLHGRNLDYHFRGTPLDDGGAVAKLLLDHSTLFVCHPRDRASFLSIGWPGMIGVSTAVNEAGISLGHLTSYLRGTTPNGTPGMMIYRTIVEEAGSLGEAGMILRSSRRTTGNNLLVGSGGENRARLFEVTMDTVEEVEPREGVLVAANHFMSAALARRQRPYLLPHSVTRWKRLAELSERDGTSPEEAARFLADRESAAGEGILSRVANDGTAVSVLFHPAEGELWLGSASKPPASSSFIRLDVSEVLAMGRNRGTRFRPRLAAG